jgi:hypothetical protein
MNTTTHFFYTPDNRKIRVSSRLGRLIQVGITHGRKYAILDLDTLRDGGWWLPAIGEETIRRLLQEFSIPTHTYELGPRTLVAWRVPLTVVDELAHRLTKTVRRYRCEHAEGLG